MELQISDIRLNRVLEAGLTMIKEKAMKHEIRLVVEMNGIPETIQADERRLKQIIYNLLSNAVKFNPNGGSIHLSANRLANADRQAKNNDASSKEYIQISIKDSGIGLKKENLTKIFQPFEQMENSSSRQFQGTGLGLSLAKSLVKLNGGKIWV